MNRQGQFDVARKTMYWMMAGIAISIMVVFFAFIVGGYRSRLTTIPPELPAELISVRFMNIAACFAYEDAETLRVYSGIIDPEKFTAAQLNKCYATDEDKGYREINFQLELEGKTIATNNYVQNVPHWSWERQVLIRHGTTMDAGMLKITAQAGLYSRP